MNATETEIHQLIQERYSSLAFSPREVDDATLYQLFEAARWAASSFNEQPWRFIYAHKGQEQQFQQILNCIAPNNQLWAKEAPTLMISIARTNFIHKERPNSHAFHDLGQAIANFSLQATHLGLSVHQMAGFDSQKAKIDLSIPNPFEAVAAVALGYPGEIEDLPVELRSRATKPRERKDLSELVFLGSWGNTR